MRRLILVFTMMTMISASFAAQVPTRKDLVRAVIASVEGDSKPIEVQFNPKEITTDKAVSWQSHRNSEGDAPTLEFTAGEPKALTVELMFDTFEDKSNVYDRYIGALEKLALIDEQLKRPPMVTFTWGSNFPVFKGVIEDLNVKYTLFLPDGTPCRATVTLRMRQADRVMNHEEAGSCSTDADCPSNQACQSGACVAR